MRTGPCGRSSALTSLPRAPCPLFGQDFGVNRQNGVLHEVIRSGKYPRVKLLPFYELTRPRWRWHFGNCTHRPNGWNYETCCDCSHFCFTPGMWRAHLHDLKTNLLVAH